MPLCPHGKPIHTTLQVYLLKMIRPVESAGSEMMNMKNTFTVPKNPIRHQGTRSQSIGFKKPPLRAFVPSRAPSWQGLSIFNLAVSKNRIDPAMTVLDIVSAHRSTEAVFKRYDARAGECICCNALFEPLFRVAKRYGLDLEALLRDLENDAGRVK